MPICVSRGRRRGNSRPIDRAGAANIEPMTVHPALGRILVDADACPVKDDVYRVAFRRGVAVRVVSNAYLRVPDHELVERVVVSDAFDAADDWIVEQEAAKDVVITGDILLADRCLKAGATVIGHNGKPFTNASIGGAIATRYTSSLTGQASASIRIRPAVAVIAVVAA